MTTAHKLRGRPSSVERQSAIAMVEHFIKYFQEPHLPPWSSDVWQQMSKYLRGKWSAQVVYTNVRENRRKILSTARANQGIIITQDDNNNPLYVTDLILSDEERLNDSDRETSLTQLKDQTMKFDLILTKDEWAEIKPNTSTKCEEIEEVVLKPKVWTNVVATAFYRQFRMPCAFMFKKHIINTSSKSKYFLKITGYCSSKKCGNTFYGYALEDPGDEGLILQVHTRDTRDLQHESVKRPLNGNRRKVVSKELREKGYSVWRKDQARENLRPGETEGPMVPNPATARQAKREGIYKEYEIKPADGRDLINSIEEMSTRPPYIGFIHSVGSQPFYVFYSALAQLHAYKEYCRINKNRSVISVDATGSLVQKLKRANGARSGHIFLYAIVINFNETSLCVYQMLSEKHDTEFITYWLRQWLRKGAPKPIEAVSDYSRALLSALCLAFNDITIKCYVDTCFTFLIRDNSAHCLETKIHTRIRVDVAHLTHLACRWKCWNSVTHKTVRDFLIHCVALMVDSQTVAEFEEIFLLTCTVALQEHDDNEVDLAQAFTAKEAREILESRIAVKGIVVKTEAEDNTDKDLTHSILDSVNPVEFEKISNKNQSPIRAWIDQLLSKAKISKHDGKILNPYYVPKFIDNLKRLAYEFPLWTGVTVPHRASHASSAYVEGVFKDLKKDTLKSFTLPIRVDLFLTIHARDLIGGTILLSSKFVTFNIERYAKRDEEQNRAFSQTRGATEGAAASVAENNARRNFPLKKKKDDSDKESSHDIKNIVCPISPIKPHDDSDLFSQENWRGKTEELEQLDLFAIDAVLNEDPQAFLESNAAVGIFASSTLSSTYLEETFTAILSDHSYNKIEEGRDQQDIENTDDTIEGNHANNNICSSSDNNISDDNAFVKQIPKLKKPTKFYDPCPEIRWKNDPTIKSRKPYLLPNGGPVTIDGITIFLRNTCAFDSIVHALMTSAIDDPWYASIIEKSKNIILRLVLKLITSGRTQEVLRDRATIINRHKVMKHEIETKGRVISYSIDAEDSVANTWKMLFTDSEPSAYKTVECKLCRNDYDVSNIPTLGVNHRTIANEGFGALQKALEFHERICNVRCVYEGCPGTDATIITMNNHCIYVELDIRTHPSAQCGLECTLDDFTTTIELNVKYRLTAVLAFRADARHFVTYCKRSNGKWQCYDNLKVKSEWSSNTRKIVPHGAIYIADKH